MKIYHDNQMLLNKMMTIEKKNEIHFSKPHLKKKFSDFPEKLSEFSLRIR